MVKRKSPVKEIEEQGQPLKTSAPIDQSSSKKEKHMSGMNILEFAVDLNDVEAPDPLPPGEYPAQIVEATLKTSANSGNQYLALTFEIATADFPPDYKPGDDSPVKLGYNRLVFDPNSQRSLYNIKKFLSSIGHGLSNTLDLDGLVGAHASVKVTHQEFEGEWRAQISGVGGAE